MVTSTYSMGSDILIKPETARRNGCIISKTGVLPNEQGEYIVKAGTPLYGTTEAGGYDRSTALSVSSTSGTAQGVLYEDVKFENGASQANGTLVINGEVDFLKLDSTVQAMITTAVQTSLNHIQFIKGRAD